MRRWLSLLFASLVAGMILSSPALAVRPDEMLADPALEERAREISSQLRCMVCQNETIDESEADLARDLRILVRERLKAGDTNQQVLDFVVSRYGEFVLLKPRFDLKNALLWGAPLILLIGGAVVLFFRAQATAPTRAAGLSRDEEERLERILRKDEL